MSVAGRRREVFAVGEAENVVDQADVLQREFVPAVLVERFKYLARHASAAADVGIGLRKPG